MNRNIQALYEQMLINEVAGATNYWLDPTGDLISVEDHSMWVLDNFQTPIKYIPSERRVFNVDTKEYIDWDTIYEYAYNEGYIRVVMDSSNIYFTYSEANKPTKQQFMVLYGLAEDKNKNLEDGNTQKIIVSKNMETTQARPEALDRMEQDLQPSFYNRKKSRYYEGADRFLINDYTKLIS